MTPFLAYPAPEPPIHEFAQFAWETAKQSSGIALELTGRTGPRGAVADLYVLTFEFRQGHLLK
jgi:hypothetical protein